ELGDIADRRRRDAGEQRDHEHRDEGCNEDPREPRPPFRGCVRVPRNETYDHGAPFGGRATSGHARGLELCVPASRRVCLYRGELTPTVSFHSSGPECSLKWSDLLVPRLGPTKSVEASTFRPPATMIQLTSPKRGKPTV